MDLIVHPQGRTAEAAWGGARFPCALGKGGVTRAKREGDGATPAGAWRMTRLLYRPDREAPPPTALPLQPITALDGWCDGPASPLYNRQVRLPQPASCERLWRGDRLYDLLVVLDHNSAPPVPGAGSAIFLHLARANYGPTDGCVALARADLLRVLAGVTPMSRVVVKE